MQSITISAPGHSKLKRVAQAGFVAKGVVYFLLGIIALLVATQQRGGSDNQADKSGVFTMLRDITGGNWLLPLLGVGLLCYCAWRLYEAYYHISKKGKERWKGLRYFFSGIVYLSVAVSAFRVAFNSSSGNGDNQQQLAAELLSKPFGQWMMGIAALIIAAVGIYQLYYALSEKYKKHVQKLNLAGNNASLLLASGKIGYCARGIVWLIIAFLAMRSAIHASSKEAGDTGKALSTLGSTTFGPYLLGAVAIGLMCYGFFNLIRARYENFETK